MTEPGEADSGAPGERALEQLYPDRGPAPLTGLYLCEDLRSRAADDGVYLYTNFVTSLDGRIALVRPDGADLEVPTQTANPRDWRLLLELAASADAIIVSGRYVRQLAEGTAQAWPPFAGDAPADLITFREAQGIERQPALVVVTGSLDLPPRALERLADRRLIIATTEQALPTTAASLRGLGCEVLALGAESVDGGRLVSALGERGLRAVYSIAGPAVLHTLLRARVVQRVYLTTVLRVLGGTDYATLAQGPLLDPPYDLKLAAIYLDAHGPGGVEQLLQVFDRRPAPSQTEQP